MENVAIEQLNIPAESGWYFVPTNFLKQSFAGRKISPATLMVESLFYSFSKKDEKKEDTRLFNGSYSQIAARLGVSNSTVARSVKLLTEGQAVTQNKDGRTCARYAHNEESRTLDGIIVYDYLYDVQITVREHKLKTGRVIPAHTRKLKKLEVYLLSLLIQTRKDGSEQFSTSVRKLQRTLNLGSADTSRNYLSDLLYAGVINRPKKGQGNRLNYYSLYTVDEKFLRTERKRILKATKRTERSAVRKEPSQDKKQCADYLARIADANARAEREHWYAVRKAEAERRAERWRGLAMNDEAYKTAYTTSRRVEIKLAQAEAFHQPTSELEAQLTALRGKMAERLAFLHIKEENLTAQHFCKKCSDTGFLPNGKPCDCYSPPGSSAR